MATKLTRRKRRECRALPSILTARDVETASRWPLGKIKTATAKGEGWTDCLLHIVPEIRLGGRFNSRRVRYDGAFYIVVNGRRVPLDADVSASVLDVASHVYGVRKEDDNVHNKILKGY
jgi:hypothetical protein